MSTSTKANEADASRPDSALVECNKLIKLFDREAKRHHNLAWTASLSIVLSGALIPVMIVVSTKTGAFIFGKLLPAALAAIAAIALGAAQFVRPYDRWRGARRVERWLETERFKYIHKLANYSSPDEATRDEELLKALVTARNNVQADWEALMPLDTGQALAETPKPPPGT